jgi:hypothetical protein
MKRFFHLLLGGILLLACATMTPAPSNAAPYLIQDHNSIVLINPESQSGIPLGVYTWQVDNVSDLMYQQWFWYRVGSTGPESPINTISAPTIALLAPNIVQFSYFNSTLSISVLYALTGGAVGSGYSDLQESISITNLSTDPLNLHFFQYCDFDMNQVNAVDNVAIAAAKNSATQTPVTGASILSESIVNRAADHAEANYFANTITKLNDGSPTTLNDVLNAGPGDVTWAFEWDQVIAPGSSFLISKDKQIRPIPPAPLPPSALLLGTSLLGLVGLRRFRKS